MAEENKEQIKKLETDLKTAFKDERFDDVKKLADELKNLDPENHVAERLLEKTETAEADKLKEANAGKIKTLVVQIKQAFRLGELPQINKLADEIKELDPANKTVRKIESRIEKAKKALERQAKKEKIKVLTVEIKELLSNEEWDKAVEKANELLKADEDNRFAGKTLKKAAKAKGVEVADLAKPSESVKEEPEKEPALLPVQPKIEEKPVSAEPPSAEPTEVPAPMDKKEEVATEKKAEPAVDAKKVQEEKIDHMEDDLKLALKEGREKDAHTIMDDIKKLDLENKAVKKAEAKLEKEKAKLEKQAKKEKIKGLTAEIKELLSNEEWDKAVEKANELLKADEDNRFAGKTLKKVGKAKEAEVSAPKEAPKPDKEKKPGFFAGLFKKKEEKPVSAVLAEATPKTEQAGEAVEAYHDTPNAKPEKKEEVVIEKKAEPAVVMPKAAPAPAQPAVPVTPPSKPKEAKKEEVKPAVAPKLVVPVPVTPKAEPVLPAEKSDSESSSGVKPAPAISEAKPMVAAPIGAANELAGKKPIEGKGAKGNIFTKLFGKKEEAPKPTKSIIDTIVAKTGKAKVEKREKKKEKDTEAGLLKFATAFLEFSIAFILISAGFFYAYNIDEQNRALELVGIEENNASRLHTANQTLEEKKAEEKELNKEIQKYREGYEDERRETIEKIVENRMDWPDILRKLNEVTESVYEKNALAQYVQYNNYSYNVETGQFSVSATLSDPLGRNLTKLAEIEEAFMNYPKDPDDDEDETKPYFYGLKEFRSFSKTFDRTTGRYKSTFSLTIYTKEPEKKK